MIQKQSSKRLLLFFFHCFRSKTCFIIQALRREDLRVLRVPKVPRVMMVHQEDHPARWGLKDKRAPKAPRVPEVCPEQTANKEYGGSKASKVPRGPWVLPDKEEYLDPRACEDRKVDHKASRVHEAKEGHKAKRDPLVHREFKDPRGLQAPEVSRGLRAGGHKVLGVIWVHRDPRVPSA